MDSGENQIDVGLWAAYRETTFEAQLPGVGAPLQIRIDETCEPLDVLLEDSGVQDWVFITAWNPGPERPERPGDQVNRQRNRMLHEDLLSLEIPVFQGVGRGEDPAWEPEESFLALGITLERGIELGRKYGQAAIVAGSKGGCARLVDCSARIEADGKSNS